VVTSGPPLERIAFARELPISDLSAAAYQIEVSAKRLMPLWPSSLPAPVGNGLCEHDVLVPGDIRAAGSTKIEHCGWLGGRLWSAKIPR